MSKTIVVHSMVGDMEVGETEWGDQDAMMARVKAPYDGGSSNIRVVVKIRPPNEREKALPGGVIVSVGDDGRQVMVENKPPFTYDVAFPMDTTQLEVFEKIGVDIVTTAYNGYNASMFAYGQTSSGKSFSMMGVRGTALVGLIPRISNLLFYCIKGTPEHEFFVEGSYLEIYNEKLRDLLGGGDDLKVRENPQLGVHVAGLTKHHVATAEGVEKIIEDGTGNRTVAATKYNSESSRSHAVFELHIQQKYKDKVSGEDMQSKVKIALIDLAGSERSDKLGSVGKALQEGNNINKSLTVLGRCIKALVEKANDPKKKIVVPFRESVLTYYLRESLAGNARTTMLAACSPAGSNEEETLSTLRYAASAKQIKTSAKKSEDPLKAKINELTGEVEKLKALLAKSGGGGGGAGAGHNHRKSQMMNMMKGNAADAAVIHDELAHLTDEEKTAYLKELEEQMELMGLGGFKKVQEARPKGKKRASQMVNPREIFPQLSCLNKDEMLSHAMVIPITTGKLTIGRSGLTPKNDFEIDGMGMLDRHCVINAADKEYSLTLERDNAVVHVNGTVITGAGDENKVTLKHLDRVILGPCRIVCLYLTEKIAPADRARLNYALAFREFMNGDEDASRLLMSPRRQALLDQVQEVDGVMLKQANAVAAELCTNIKFASQLLIGAEGFNIGSTSIDEILDSNEKVRIKVCCVVGTESMKTKEEVASAMASFREQEKDLMVKKASARELRNSADQVTTPKTDNSTSSIKVDMDQLLFEVQADDFEDLLGELKAMHNSLGALLGGVNASTTNQDNMIKTVFEAVDTDGSGSIDKYELQACIEKFNVEADPTFFKHVLREEGIKEDDELDFEKFEAFLIRFLQHQFYKKIESYVTNKPLFLTLGGRSVIYSHRGTILENKSRHSMFASRSASTNLDDEEGEEEEEDTPEISEEELERIARQKKLGREAKQARMRQRMRQNAVVTNLITTLKGDLQKAMGDLEEITETDKSGAAEKSAASKLPGKLSKRKKKKTEKDVYSALADKIKKAIKDLEAQHKTTVMVSKERDQLEDYLTRMLAERDAMIPDGGSDDEGGGDFSGGLPGLGDGGGGGAGGFMDRPGKAMNL